MIFEIWYFKALLPNGTGHKARPVLIIGNDSENNLNIVDIHYCLVSSSSSAGKYDVEIADTQAKALGLSRASIIKTTKIYTGSKRQLERKVCDLPDTLRKEFLQKYQAYQNAIISNMHI